MIYQERVIAGQQLCRLVHDSLSDIGIGEAIVDLGAGSGRVIQAINDLGRETSVIGVEIDEGLCYQAQEAGLDFINADAGHMPFENESTDRVTAINSFHEIATHPDKEARLELFEAAINEVSRIMKLGGKLLMFDGFMPENETQSLRLNPRREHSLALLKQFNNEYVARKPDLSIDDSVPVVVETDLATVTTLLTKLKYLINAQAWNGERQQLYPFANLNSITAIMERAGLRVDSTDFPAANVRLGLRSLFGNFVIATTDGTIYQPRTFPACQVLVNATKVERVGLPVGVGDPVRVGPRPAPKPANRIAITPP